MSNYVVVNDGQDYGTESGRLAAVMQGEVGPPIIIDVRDLAGNDKDITNATGLEGRLQNVKTEVVIDITGTLAVSGGGISWTRAAEDIGTAGNYSAVFEFVLGGKQYKTFPASIAVIADPAANDVGGVALVKIPETDADYLEDLVDGTTAATDGQVWTADGAGGAAFEDAGGAVDSVFGRTGAVTAATSDYDAVQVDFTPAGTIAATNVQAAIEELDTEKSATGHTHSYQPLDAGLTDLAGLAVANGNIPVGDGTNWVAESGATLRNSIGAAAASDLTTHEGLTGAAHGGVLPTGGGTMAGTLAMADNLITRPKFTDYGETVNAIGSIGGGTQDINLELGNVVSGTVDTSTTTFTFSNPSASGTACSFTLFLTNGGSQTVNWPASVDWAGGAAPTLTAAGVDVLTFATLDGGSVWFGFAAGLDMS